MCPGHIIIPISGNIIKALCINILSSRGIKPASKDASSL